MLCKNSLFSYFALIQCSFSSLLEEGLGLACPPVFRSQIEFATVFPIASIRLRGPGLKTKSCQVKKESCLSDQQKLILNQV